MTSAATAPRNRPKQERAQQTYELILDVAGNLLAEVGIDRISTNMICARAGISPPALYRYFVDKYAVLEALGRRLMARQNEALDRWIQRHEGGGAAALRSNVEDLLRSTAAVTASEPGAVWILRALHASPKLVHIRLESHRHVTDRLTDAYIRLGSKLPREELWRRVRLSVEIGFALDEMLQEDTGLSEDETFAYAANLMQADLSR
ncbi:TetR/AcrR family transcriptional regulator [Sphingomonas sp. Tas61C01]|uniref:TetR/AcrR family transcriptional regulator n=1 Tax=Sphingomonas sp. Tas61C01 TaxID=3458297 RepID=UPI00403EE044